eukprot:scaffold502142_cov45-Prasinocladus_malaysianus.AAC.1
MLTTSTPYHRTVQADSSRQQYEYGGGTRSVRELVRRVDAYIGIQNLEIRWRQLVCSGNAGNRLVSDPVDTPNGSSSQVPIRKLRCQHTPIESQSQSQRLRGNYPDYITLAARLEQAAAPSGPHESACRARIAQQLDVKRFVPVPGGSTTARRTLHNRWLSEQEAA